MNSTCAATVLAAAVLADLMLGEPPVACHPVVWIGRAIAGCRRFAPRSGATTQLMWGAVIAVGVPAAVAALAWWLLDRLDGTPWASAAVSVFLLTSAFAIRALGTAASAVRRALDARDLDGARSGMSALCSRDASALGEQALVGATVESVAENACDSFIAPVFYYCLFGVPGALAFRALNTLDSMLGYRGDYEYLGKASARLDDLANLIPARITAALFLIVGAVFGGDVRNGWRVWRRDGARTASPNAGQTMATMAGLLRVRLSKNGCYDLGDTLAALEPAHIARAWRIALASMLTFTALLIGATLAS
jgi:adenosylcobinamide-phosphate synthase